MYVACTYVCSSCPPLFRELRQGRNDVLALLTPGGILTSYSPTLTTLPTPL